MKAKSKQTTFVFFSNFTATCLLDFS